MSVTDGTSSRLLAGPAASTDRRALPGAFDRLKQLAVMLLRARAVYVRVDDEPDDDSATASVEIQAFARLARKRGAGGTFVADASTQSWATDARLLAGLGPVAGALAIGIHSIGTLGKLTAEVIEGIDSGPVEAARAAGGRWAQIQRWGVLPQVLPEIIAFWLYRFEINIRAAAVLGVVGAGGIGFIIQQTIVFGRFPRAGTALLVVIVATIAVDAVSGWVRRRIIEGADRKAAQAEVFEQPELAETPA